MTSVTSRVRAPEQAGWLAYVNDDLQRLEDKMSEVSRMGHATLDAAVEMIIRGGGKRVRPSITLLIGRLFGAATEAVLSVAASVELLHTATLVHDDLIDGAPERRGVPTLHSKLSAGVTVLTGDFLFARAAALAAEANNVRVVQLFAETLVRICRGEILQAQTRWQVPEEDVYIERIYGKTAALFEASAASGAIVSGASEAEIIALGEYGRQLGLAFQIVDDALDFVSTTQKLGKPAGNDMRQGIFNLPVMYYVAEGHITEAELVDRVDRGEGLDALVSDIQQTCMVEKSLDVARSHARQAEATLDGLGDYPYVEALRSLSRYTIDREY